MLLPAYSSSTVPSAPHAQGTFESTHDAADGLLLDGAPGRVRRAVLKNEQLTGRASSSLPMQGSSGGAGSNGTPRQRHRGRLARLLAALDPRKLPRRLHNLSVDVMSQVSLVHREVRVGGLPQHAGPLCLEPLQPREHAGVCERGRVAQVAAASPYHSLQTARICLVCSHTCPYPLAPHPIPIPASTPQIPLSPSPRPKTPPHPPPRPPPPALPGNRRGPLRVPRRLPPTRRPPLCRPPPRAQPRRIRRQQALPGRCRQRQRCMRSGGRRQGAAARRRAPAEGRAAASRWAYALRAPGSGSVSLGWGMCTVGALGSCCAP